MSRGQDGCASFGPIAKIATASGQMHEGPHSIGAAPQRGQRGDQARRSSKSVIIAAA